MTEAVGAASMMEIPVVYVNVQRAGPSTGVPTKTEQGDLWQVIGASQGDYERLIVAPRDSLDAFNAMPELFQSGQTGSSGPAILISDLLISEGRYSIDPDLIDMHPVIDRGQLITEPVFPEWVQALREYRVGHFSAGHSWPQRPRPRGGDRRA